MEESAHDVHILWSPDLAVGSALPDARNRAKVNLPANAAEAGASTTPVALAAWRRNVMYRLDLLMAAEEHALDVINYPEWTFYRQLHEAVRTRMQAVRLQPGRVES